MPCVCARVQWCCASPLHRLNGWQQLVPRPLSATAAMRRRRRLPTSWRRPPCKGSAQGAVAGASHMQCAPCKAGQGSPHDA